MNLHRLPAYAKSLRFSHSMRSWGAFLLLVSTSAVQAGEIDMRDFIRLRRGMSQAEVVYRVGEPDYEDACYDCGGVVVNNGYYPPYPYQTTGPYSGANCGFVSSGGGPAYYSCAPVVQTLGPLQRWYYVPDQGYANQWITEIIFDHSGHVMRLNRDRARP